MARRLVCSFALVDPKASFGGYMSPGVPGSLYQLGPLGSQISDSFLCNKEEIIIPGPCNEIQVCFEHPMGLSLEYLHVNGSRGSLARAIAQRYQELYRRATGRPHTSLEAMALSAVWQNSTTGIYELDIKSF